MEKQLMGRILFVPEIFLSEDVISDRWRLLIWMLRDKLGFKIATMDGKIPEGTKIIMTIGLPRHMPTRASFFANKKIKIIVYTADIHKMVGPEHKEKVRRILERCDVHLSSGDEIFKNDWPGFVGKHVYFPYFFASQNRYESLEFNENPTMKCLLTGHVAKVYKLRRAIYCFTKARQPGSEMFEVLGHPGNLNAREKSSIVGADYAKLLNRYFCGITSTLHGYPLAKHFEIMASGSLLLSNESKDLVKLGMMPGEHYVSATVENYKETVKECIENPEKYRKIRKKGMEFSRKNHSIENRLSTISGIIKKLEA